MFLKCYEFGLPLYSVSRLFALGSVVYKAVKETVYIWDGQADRLATQPIDVETNLIELV